MTRIKYRKADVDGLKIFYREAGPADAQALLLLHGFPTASHMFRDLIPLLADRFRVVAPDLPGFGQSDMPAATGSHYTFDNIAGVIDRFTEIVGLKRFALYVFDYGAPTGFRIAVKHPDRITAIISQNGNAYEEGLSEGWNPIRAYWRSRRRPIGRRCAPSSLPRRRAGNTRMAWRTRRRSPRTASRSTISTWRGPARTRSSSTCSATTRATSRSTRPFKVLPQPQAAAAGGLGQERSLLPAGRRRGVQARHPGRGRPLLRHRPLRPGNTLPTRSPRRYANFYRILGRFETAVT